MATHSSILACEIPWTGEPGGLQSMGLQKSQTLKDEPPRLVGNQYATGDHWRNNSIKNEETGPKPKTKTKTKHPVLDVTGDGSKVQWCKEQYCIGT